MVGLVCESLCILVLPGYLIKQFYFVGIKMSSKDQVFPDEEEVGIQQLSLELHTEDKALCVYPKYKTF